MLPRHQLDTREHHSRQIEAITRLVESDGWVYYFRPRIEKRREEIVAQVMSPSTAPTDVPALRQLHAELGNLLAMPERDRTISVHALEP